MKFCQNHWDKLKAAIEARGLGQFIATDGSEAMRRVTEGLPVDGKPATEPDPKTAFEPLMGAHFGIVNNALRVVGIDLMMPGPKGEELCPMCVLTLGCQCGKGDECNFMSWIGHAADDQLKHAKALGLLGEA